MRDFLIALTVVSGIVAVTVVAVIGPRGYGVVRPEVSRLLDGDSCDRAQNA